MAWITLPDPTALRIAVKGSGQLRPYDEPEPIESPAARWAIGVLSVVVFGAVVIVLYGIPGRGFSS